MMHKEGRRAQPSVRTILTQEETTKEHVWLCVAKGRGRQYSVIPDLGIHMALSLPSRHTPRMSWLLETEKE
ncbi:hypothetical protein RRG08_050135 [Elysia crispata]|uniref:Uncharacterized protein n=1 Tax=Elysia crispata TaxID=231223 RepID=A0AAE0Z7Y8_9GAST|nr:hypothetical protein RRG08_050135 [Elysia crispata]